MSGLSSIGQIGGALNDKKKADLLAKEGAARIKESEQQQKMNQQKIDATETTRKLSEETEARGALSPKAMEGEKTADGRAVDMMAIKSAKQADSDAKLYNLVNQGKEGFLPMSGGAFRKMQESRALEANKADEESIRTEERATETHKSKMETEKSNREAGRYTPVVLGDGRLASMNTRTGGVKDTGEKGQLKAGANAAVDGETAIPGMKPIAGTKITKDSVTKVKDAFAKYTDFKTQLSEYRSLIDANGAEAIGENADALEAYSTGLAMTLKELQNLGVLNGPDLALLQKQIPAAAGFKATLKSAAYGAAGQNSLKPRLDALASTMDSKFASMARANGFQMGDTAPAAPTAAKPAQSITLPDEEEEYQAWKKAQGH